MLYYHWLGDRQGIQPIYTCATYPPAVLFWKGKQENWENQLIQVCLETALESGVECGTADGEKMRLNCDKYKGLYKLMCESFRFIDVV